MKKPRILWITDDQVYHKELYTDSFKDVGKLTLTERFIYHPCYDIVLVDYGHLGGIKNALVLKRYYKNKIPVIWTGGLGGSRHYIEDCKKMFPNETYLHTFRSLCLDNLKHWIAEEFHLYQKERDKQ